MRLVPARTAVRATTVLATTSLAIGLLGMLAPAGEASATRHLARSASTARVPAWIRNAHRPTGPDGPTAHQRPAVRSASDVMTDVMKALSGAPLAGLRLPPLISWQLSHLRPGSHWPAAAKAGAGTGSIAGTVTGDGNPLASICVLAVPAHGAARGIGTTVTAKTGRYKLSGLTPGRYLVTFDTFDGNCQNRGNWLEQWYRGIDSPSPTGKTVAVPVRAGQVTRGISARLHHGAQITGTVHDTSGKPLSGICAATISLTGGDDVTIAEGISGKSGRYVLGGLFPGKYLAIFVGCRTKGNYAVQIWRHAKSFSRANPIKVVAKTTVTGIDPVMLPGGTLLGTVRAGNNRGKPVRGVCVSVVGANDFFSEARTGKSGSFKIKGFGAGRYDLDLDPTCDGDKASPYLEADRTFKATGGQILREGNVPLRVGARLTGTVRDSAGHPLAGVCVLVDDEVDDVDPGLARTGSNGNYTIEGIVGGKFAVRFTGCATSQSVLTQYYDDQPTESSADKIRFQEGKTVSGIDATMQPAGTLTGLVTGSSGHPLAHVCVGIVSAGASDLIDSGFESTARTMANGRYRLRNVIPGPYQVSIGCYGGQFAGQWFDNQPDSARGGFLSISASLVTTLNGRVGQSGAISGTVTDQAGKPVNDICVFIVDPKAKVYINHDVGPPDFGPPLTEHGGRYKIGGLTPGQYLVDFVSCAGGKFADGWYHGGTTLANAKPVTVRAGRTTTGIGRVLVEGGIISGTVTGPAGQPARNICVEAFDSASLGYQFATTSKTGHYTMRGLDSGRYLVYFAPCSVRGTNLGAASAPALVQVTRPRTTTVNIALKAGGTISGKVLGGPGGKTPQIKACVLAVPTDPNGSTQSVLTKADGSYLLPDLTPGKYRVYFGDIFCIDFDSIAHREATTAPQWFSDQAAEAAATTITVTSGHTKAGINAIMHPYGTISGTVRGQSNQPVSGECVTAVPTKPQVDLAIEDQPIPNVTAITTAAGRYTLIGLPGQYKIKFSAACGVSGFATQWWPNAPSAKVATPVTIAYGTTTGVSATLHR